MYFHTDMNEFCLVPSKLQEIINFIINYNISPGQGELQIISGKHHWNVLIHYNYHNHPKYTDTLTMSQEKTLFSQKV